MASPLAVYMSTCVVGLLCLLYCQLSSSQPFVSLRFHGTRVQRSNVKEYVILGDFNGISCFIEDPPTIKFNGTMCLYRNDKLVQEIAISDENLHLFWNDPTLSSTSQFHCEADLRTTKILSKIIGSNISPQHFSQITGTRNTCLASKSRFLLNELVYLICLSNEAGTTWSSDAGDLKRLDNNEIRNAFHVTTDYLFSKSYSINATCQSGPARQSCSLRLQPSASGLDIGILTKGFSFERRVFSCYTNLPTDRISWRINSTNGNILDFYHGEDNEISFSITHDVNSSKLTIDTEVKNLISVSCETRRSGYIALATVYNHSSWIRPRPIPTSTSGPAQNISSTQNAFSFIISIVILAVLLCFVTLYLIFQKLCKSKDNVKQNQMTLNSAINVRFPEGPYHPTSSEAYSLETYDDINGEDIKFEKRSTQFTPEKTEGIDHLTTDVLEEGAIVTLNEIYQTN